MGPFNPRVRSSSTERQVKNWLNFVSSGTGGAPFKTIQTGTITISAGQTSGTATITAVTTNNAVVLFNGCSTTDDTVDAPASAYIVLTNGTTVTATTLTAEVNDLTVQFTVLEFNSGSVKSLQRGVITLTGVASNTATITAVVVAKSWMPWSGDTANSITSARQEGTCVLTNTTTVTVARGSTTGNFATAYQVVEMN